MYYAPGATHAPHHVPKEWSDKYAGQFDGGWDKLREQTVRRQREIGVIPADAELTARPAEIPGRDDMPEGLKPVLARQMEIYAGFLEHTDHHIGRLIDSLAGLEILDDTLVYVIIGDNGASGEGTLNGTVSEGIPLNGASAIETVEFMTSRIDEFGGPNANNHFLSHVDQVRSGDVRTASPRLARLEANLPQVHSPELAGVPRRAQRTRSNPRLPPPPESTNDPANGAPQPRACGQHLLMAAPSPTTLGMASPRPMATRFARRRNASGNRIVLIISPRKSHGKTLPPAGTTVARATGQRRRRSATRPSLQVAPPPLST